METVLNEYTIQVPTMDLAFFRSLIKKMGWTMKKSRKSGIQKALEDVEAGRVYEAKSIEDLMEQLDA